MTKALIFLAAGVAIGLMLAPETGRDFRKKIMNVFEEATGKSEDILEDAVDGAKSKAQSVGRDAEHMANRM